MRRCVGACIGCKGSIPQGSLTIVRDDKSIFIARDDRFVYIVRDDGFVIFVRDDGFLAMVHFFMSS